MRNAGFDLVLPDRTIKLKLDFAAMEAAEAEGLDLLNGGLGKATGVATFLWAVGQDAAPDLTRDDWLAILLTNGEQCGVAVASLYARYGWPGGKDEEQPAGESGAANG